MEHVRLVSGARTTASRAVKEMVFFTRLISSGTAPHNAAQIVNHLRMQNQSEMGKEYSDTARQIERLAFGTYSNLICTRIVDPPTK